MSNEAIVRVATDAGINNNHRVRLITPREADLLFPFLPESIEVSGKADTWVEQERPGRTPLLARTGKSLTKYTMVAPLAGGGWEIENWLNVLRRHAESVYKTTLYLSFRWLDYVEVTEVAWDESDWDEKGRPIRVDVTLTLTEESKGAKPVGPVVSGHVHDAIKKKKTKG